MQKHHKAFFGLGDQAGYDENSLGGMGTL